MICPGRILLAEPQTLCHHARERRQRPLTPERRVFVPSAWENLLRASAEPPAVVKDGGNAPGIRPASSPAGAAHGREREPAP